MNEVMSGLIEKYNIKFKKYKILNLFIIFQTKQLGDTSLSTVTLDVNADGDTTDTQDTAVSDAINTVINKINNYATPSC